MFNGNGTPILTYSIVAGSATHGTVTLVDANGAPVTSNTTGAYVFTPTPNYGDQHGRLADRPMPCSVDRERSNTC